MKQLNVDNATRELIARQTLPGHRFVSRGRRLPDGSWLIVVDDEVAAVIEEQRLLGESDDNAVSRLVRAAIGQRPN
ncbi:MAG TPA: hypothetical protein VGV07_11145 [Devosia sp.]|jgi:hypothetical protein|uniref:hypothetical protein n=1 Tax=Devosia sp. TaxID=1871048 RepID=UPI002DDD1C21|nr:hypothetical protein [Devosia sp.]HEV2515797.1 hypothetical protein [Devosia sp.]